MAETEGEGKTGSEAEPRSGSEQESETEPEPETGTEGSTDSVNRQDADHYLKSLVDRLTEIGFGTETETETGTETGTTEAETETSVIHEDLQQVHTDLQVICCFIVVFLVILLCDYIYKFFRIFF